MMRVDAPGDLKTKRGRERETGEMEENVKQKRRPYPALDTTKRKEKVGGEGGEGEHRKKKKKREKQWGVLPPDEVARDGELLSLVVEGHVVHEEYADRAPQVLVGERVETLLPGSVPQLQLYVN